MFVRAVWRSQRPVEIKRGLRESGPLSKRSTDIPGICRPDFPQMTRALFDRQR